MGADINSQGARIGALEQQVARLETRTEDNWKNLSGDIKELKEQNAQQTNELKDLRADISKNDTNINSRLSGLEGQMKQLTGCFNDLTAYIEQVTKVKAAQEQQQKEIVIIKQDIQNLKEENIDIRKSKITAWTSVAVAIIAGVFSIITFFLKK